MPTPTPEQPGVSDVQSQIYGRFIDDLASKALPAEVVARLRKTLIETRIFTETALKAAILSEEPLP